MTDLVSAVASPAVPKRRHARKAQHGNRTRPLSARVNAVAVALVLVDLLALGAGALRTSPGWGAILLTGALLLITRSSGRVYRRRLWLSWFQDLPRSLLTTATTFALLAVWTMLTDQPPGTTTALQHLLVLFVVCGEPGRFATFWLGRWGRRRFGRCDRTLVVGAGKVGADLVATMLEHPQFGLRPVGVIDSEPVLSRAELPVDVLDEELASAITRLGVGTVILAFSDTRDTAAVDAAITAHRLGCTTLVVPRMFELYQDNHDVERLRSYPLVRLGTAPTSRPSWWVKRTVDVVLAALALAALSPLIGLCGLAVLVESGRPVIFRQVRIGMDGRRFRIFKLRSVRPGGIDDSQTKWSVQGDARVGPVGRFLRSTSLDELPQLWNIVRGDMSIVGPRPERPVFVREFSAIHELYWARHRVPAGLTGLAQVHGLRGDTSIADRSRYDNYYIANWSLWLDLKILVLTVGELACRKQR
jgi:exopolysaccharide biosynthesis polyprenyl glycosylphosphotransferase